MDVAADPATIEHLHEANTQPTWRSIREDGIAYHWPDTEDINTYGTLDNTLETHSRVIHILKASPPTPPIDSHVLTQYLSREIKPLCPEDMQCSINRLRFVITQETVQSNSDSRMNLPSLYFSLCSYALSYFHPTTSPHCLQMMSRTICRPVVMFLSAASSCRTFTTVEKRNAFPC